MELYAKGQLSYLILTCLQDRDFYGLDIISEISARSNGKINLKKPSVYSNLTRMEKQAYISSYLQNSDFGPNRKYYSLTDKGRGFYQELKAYFDYNNIDVFRDFVDIEIKSENFLNTSNTEDKQEIVNEVSPIENTQNSNEDINVENNDENDFFDFSSLEDEDNAVDTTLSDEENNTESVETNHDNLESSINRETLYNENIENNNLEAINDNNNSEIEEQKDDARFLIREEVFEEDNESNQIKEQIENQSIERMEDNQINNFTNENKTDEIVEEKKDDAVFISNADDYNKRLFDISKDINKIKRKRSFAEDQIAITTTDALMISNEKKKANIEEFKNSLLQNKAKYTYPAVNYETKSKSLNQAFNSYEKHKELSKENDKTLDKQKEVKDDAVLITGHLTPNDVGKAKKIEPPKIKIVSENTKDTRLPAPKRDSNVDPSHREILNKLYSKTKDNSSTEVREDAIYDYNDLKDYYNSQNIAFSAYEKNLEKTQHNTNLIYLSVSIATLLMCLLSSTLLYVIFLKTGMLNSNTNFMFILLPTLLIIDVAIKIYNYKMYTSWMPTQLSPLWKILCYYLLVSCIIVGLNLICGIATKSFNLFATTLILPLILALIIIPVRYFLKRILLVKYWR